MIFVSVDTVVNDRLNTLKMTFYQQFFDILGCSRHDTYDDVKAAYKQKALATHPDKHPDDQRDTKTREFQEINQAWQKLSELFEFYRKQENAEKLNALKEQRDELIKKLAELDKNIKELDPDDVSTTSDEKKSKSSMSKEKRDAYNAKRRERVNCASCGKESSRATVCYARYVNNIKTHVCAKCKDKCAKEKE